MEIPESYDCIVIGAGAGGLAGAAKMGGEGLRVLVLEQGEVGGFLCTFPVKDYHFDASLHCLCLDNDLMTFFRKHGGETLTFVPFRPNCYTSLFKDGQRVEVPASSTDVDAALIRQFPHEEEGIKKVMHTLRAIREELQRYLKLTNEQMSFKKVLGYAQMLFTSRHLLWARNKTVSAAVNEHVRDPKCRTAITQLWTFFGLPPDQLSLPLFASVLLYCLDCSCYPIGGSGALVKALSNFIVERSGIVLRRTPVTSLLIEENQICGVYCGRHLYRAPFVVNNAPLPVLVHELCPEEHRQLFLSNHDIASAVSPAERSISLFHLHLGIRDARVVHNLFQERGPLVFYNRVVDSTDQYNGATQSQFPSESAPMPNMDMMAITNYAIDPTSAPVGKTVISIAICAPLRFSELQLRTEAYARVKQSIIDTALNELEPFCPGLRAACEIIRLDTPRTYQRYTRVPGGAIFGQVHTPHGVLHRPAMKTPVKGLYLAGAWTMPGAGVPSCLHSGITAAKAIIHEHTKEHTEESPPPQPAPSHE
eukprot:gnl/Trimastix_PCT/2814.p2 GENE.gnl/Trimastix_PCT/2814~~gnl/Trimastix_PCT/2814.p2  ORF type:complete len:535 (+),score=127.03 gnl/Trimastix_PCT/2814:1399-3003(+)